MTQALVKTEAVLTPAPVAFSDDQLQVIKDTICRGANNAELQLFVATCTRTGLDPFLRQIHAVKRWDSQQKREAMAIQVGIDGLRLVAERTGKYAGQDPIEWLDEDGTWSEVWTGHGDHPIAARCSVYRKDWPGRKATAVCRWDSYAQYNGNPPKLGPTWAKMPDVMLGKCAEALALRRAFPAEMSGLAAAVGGSNYDPEIDVELQQTSIEAEHAEPEPDAIEGEFSPVDDDGPPAQQPDDAGRPQPAPARAATPAAPAPPTPFSASVTDWLEELEQRKGKQQRNLVAKAIRDKGMNDAEAIRQIKMVAGIRDETAKQAEQPKPAAPGPFASKLCKHNRARVRNPNVTPWTWFCPDCQQEFLTRPAGIVCEHPEDDNTLDPETLDVLCAACGAMVRKADEPEPEGALPFEN